MPRVKGYQQVGGIHPETASITNILAAQGLTAPHTGQPFSEAMILGISGGLGAGHILWEFKEYHIKVLVLGFKNRWQYTAQYYQALADRLGTTIAMPETGSKKAAAQNLHAALDQGKAAVAWVDRASMLYLQMPPGMVGHLGHIVSICGRDGDAYLIDDLAAQPFTIEAEALEPARGRVGSFKNRLVIVEDHSQDIPLEEAIQKGLEDCVTHLSSDSESFSLPSYRKWAKLITDNKNAKGWLKVFADRRGLFSTLSSIFEAIEIDGAPGGLRPLYANFLREASPVIGKPGLLDVSAHYDALADQWNALAEEALPDAYPLFAETKRLLRERYAITKQGGEAWRGSEAITQQIRTLRTEGNLNLPLTDAQVEDLFRALQSRLNEIYAAEVSALEALRGVAGS